MKSLQIGSIVWGVRNMERAISFWCQALEYKLKRPADEDWAILIPAEGEGIQLSLKLTTSDKPRRHHLDLFTTDKEAEISRLQKLGATQKTGWNYEADADYTVMADPDGNTFCVVQC